MSKEKPISASPITEDEVQSLISPRGTARNYKWEFPEDTFNGEWWALEVPNTKVASAQNSYRNQCEAVYGTRANCYRSTDGRVMVRRLVDEPKTRGKKEDEA